MPPTFLSQQPPLVTIDDFVNTYRDQKDDGERGGVAFLEPKGVLPLTYHNAHLPDLNILAAWLHWSGSIWRNEGRIHAQPEQKGNIKQAAENLDLKLRDKSPTELAFENGTWYARVLESMGIHNSQGSLKAQDTKAKHNIQVLPYIRFLAEHFSNYHVMHGEDRKIATKLLVDHCKILLLARFRKYRNQHYLDLPANAESEDIARRLAQQVIGMFNAVYPKMGLHPGLISHYYHKERGNHHPRIDLPEENLLAAMHHYGLFGFQPSSRYHSLGKKATGWARK